jgi:hypothetical protein
VPVGPQLRKSCENGQRSFANNSSIQRYFNITDSSVYSNTKAEESITKTVMGTVLVALWEEKFGDFMNAPSLILA